MKFRNELDEKLRKHDTQTLWISGKVIFNLPILVSFGVGAQSGTLKRKIGAIAMRTVDVKSDPDESRWTKVRRDLALARRLLAMTAYYWTKGRKLRSEFRQCEQQGKIFYVDDDPADPERRVR